MRFPGRGRLLYSAVAAVLSGVVLLVIAVTSGQASGGTAVMSAALTGQVTALPQTVLPKAVLPDSQAAPTDTPTSTDTPPTGTATPTPTATDTATATPAPTPAPTRLPTTLSLAASANAVNYEATVTVTAHLGTTQASRQVSVYAQTVRAATRKLLKTATVSAQGDLSVSYAPQYSTTFSVVFPGDARYAAKTVTRTVYVWVSVSQALASYYASETYKGTLYRIYHHTGALHDTITVAPNKHGECVKAEIQIFFQGAWTDDLQSGTTSCGSLSSSSHVPGTFGLATAAGARYRIRALFLRSASDAVNLNNDSSWRYFRVT